MYINPELITDVVIKTLEKPVDWIQFQRFLNKSPYVRRIAFIGTGIFQLPQFVQMIQLCRDKDIVLIFGECRDTTPENIDALVEYGNVICVNIYETCQHVNRLLKLKEKYNTALPDVNLIFDQTNPTPQDTNLSQPYDFYNMGHDTHNIPCLKMLTEPMINYNGDFLGCWENTDSKHPVNAFDLGLENALNHPVYKNRLKMLRTGKINMSCPCARCMVFFGLVWSNKTVDVYKKTIE